MDIELKSISNRMPTDAGGEITQLLRQMRYGEGAAKLRLLELVYPELRKLAAVYMARERRNHTLQPTALVNELYLKLIGSSSGGWENRAHFFAIAALLMRQILVDHARKVRTQKRGAGEQSIQLDAVICVSLESPEAILDLERGIAELERLDERQARIVEMRCFTGLTEVEIAEVLHMSVRTVKRDWSMAKAWLNGYLKPSH